MHRKSYLLWPPVTVKTAKHIGFVCTAGPIYDHPPKYGRVLIMRRYTIEVHSLFDEVPMSPRGRDRGSPSL